MTIRLIDWEGTMSYVSEPAQVSGPPDHPPPDRADRDGSSTSTLVVDLALVEGQLRALWARGAKAGATPHGTALQDQLETHERDILRTLHRRHLAFRPLPTGGGPGGPATGGPRW